MLGMGGCEMRLLIHLVVLFLGGRRPVGARRQLALPAFLPSLSALSPGCPSHERRARGERRWRS
jgi:hypothetical protein